MALTRDFRETVMARVVREPRFREALLAGALAAHLEGDAAAGRALLRDLVNATLGFEALARATGRPAKSLHRMLSPAGNPTSAAFFGIVRALARANRLSLRVSARAARPGGRRRSAA